MDSGEIVLLPERLVDEGEILVVPGAMAPGRLDDSELEARARRLVSRGTPENTKRAYRSDIRYVQAWCRASGLGDTMPFSVEMMVRFVVDHVDGLPEEVDEDLVREGVKRELGPHAVSTVERRVAAVSTAHQSSGLPNPCEDRQLMKLMSKARSSAARDGWRPKKKTAAIMEVLERMLATCDASDLRDVRDRAMLLFGFSSGGRRRSEVVSATFDRLTPMSGEYVYVLGVTKTEQDGDTGAVPVAGRAAEALARWIDAARIVDGPLFRPISREGDVLPRALSGKALARIVKKRAKLAGLDPVLYSGHSLRSGFMTEAGLQGVALAEAMELSKHRSIATANGYIQAGSGLRNRAARLVG